MKNHFNYLFLFLALLNSCLTDNNQSPVFTGIYDSNFVFHEYSPPLQVELVLDSATNYYSGTDSIDINLDGDFDIIISQHLQIPHLTDEPTNSLYPFCKLTTKNGLELAEKYFLYPAGHGSTQKVTWIDTLYVQQRIDNLQYWSETSKFRLMWAIPPVSYLSSFGFWYEITNPEMYIGLRMKIGSDYKYGWIKVDATSRENMHFMSYAIEK